MMNELKGKVTFNDVAGVEEPRRSRRNSRILKDPKKFSDLVVKFKRCLFVGPPGTGKLYLLEQ